MNQSLSDKTCIVIGIDVGGPRKGFHAVALCQGRYWDKFAAHDAASITTWCKRVGAHAVGIDAPCHWSLSGRARPAERALAAEGIHAFATPSRAAAEGRDFYRWMFNGAELFQLIQVHYRLFDGGNAAAGPLCFETFPQAVACALSGKIVSAKRKGAIRRELLREVGIDTAPLTNIDTVDAALCAFTAHSLLVGSVKTYGDAAEGFIIVPARARCLTPISAHRDC